MTPSGGDEAIQFVAMREADLPALFLLTESFQWPHRLEDWQFMLRLGHGVVVKRGGVLVGGGLLWPYGAGHAALGMIGVADSARRQGIGERIMAALLAEAGTRTILLTATEMAAPLYEKLGFHPANRVHQCQGKAMQAGVLPLPAGERLRPMGRNDPARLAALDAQATGLDRGGLIKALCDAGTGVVLDRDGEAVGFSLLRAFGRGLVIGPVVAQTADRARALIGHFLNAHSGQFVRVDVPDESGFAPWLAQLGLVEVGGGLAMVRGEDPKPHGDRRIFALVSQAFG